mgnify:CR=1 FL=1
MAFSPMDGVISIHSPRMGRDCPRRNLWERHGISIHSPRMGRDATPALRGRYRRFQSTLPAWGETFDPRFYRCGLLISIHSPRMGRDRFGKFDNIIVNHISIHSPRMGRDPTLSISPQIFSISIHSPRMGRDGNFRHI